MDIQTYTLLRDNQCQKARPYLNHQSGYPDTGLKCILDFQQIPWSCFGDLETKIEVCE